MAEKITELSAEDARKFFLNAKCYSTIDLPKYFDFQPLLDKLATKINGADWSKLQTNISPQSVDNVNYKFYQNKDGNLAWRKMEIIHPVLYIKLVNTITEESNWATLKTHFRKCNAITNIACCSIPFNFEPSSFSADSVTNWWERIEQQSIELSLQYDWLANTDITDCYGALYTHSIVWAIHGKETAKQKRNDKNLGNNIDDLLQNMHYRQTNGIPQGSILMDFIAEIVLGYADMLLSEKIGNSIPDFKILRYRDDYRIFAKTKEDVVKILRLLSEVLTDLNFKLNSQKTFISQEIITDSIKPDKLYWNFSKQEESTLQKHLLLIHKLSKEYSNSGSIAKALTDFMENITPQKIQNQNLTVLVAILTDIAFHNSKVYALVVAIIAKILSYESDEKTKEKIYKQIAKKICTLPNVGYLLVWLQRMVIKENYQIEECNEEILCQIVNGTKNVCELWENSWLNNEYKSIIKETLIINKEVFDNMPATPDDNEIKLFINKY